MQNYNKKKNLFFRFFAALYFSVFILTQGAAQVVPPTAPTVPRPFAPSGGMQSQNSAEDTGSSSRTSSKTVITNPGKNSGTQTQKGSSLSAAALSGLSSALLGGDGTGNLLNSLLGNKNANGLAGLDPASTRLLLEQILLKLDDLQARLEPGIQNAAAASQSQSTQGKIPSILRFTVNGFNVLGTCRTLYFSQKSSDGSFLLTGDRIYYADGGNRAETFYMFFNKALSNSYSVAVSVTQQYENPFSFLYELSQRQDLSAVQTGNLITIRINDPQWKLDILIDIAEK